MRSFGASGLVVSTRQIFSTLNSISTTPAIVTIILVSLLVKLSYIMILGAGLDTFPSEGTDARFYHAAASTIQQSGVYGLAPGYPTTGMPPGQSFFLAFLYLVGDDSIVFAKLAHIALLAAVAGLTFLTGRLISSTVIGFWAGVLIALDPAQAYLAGTFLSEPLFIFLMALGIYFLVPRQAQSRWRLVIFAGICLGLAGLTRNQGWLFSIALWVGVFLTRGRLIPVRQASVVLLLSLGIIAPWTWRNYQLTGKFVPVSSEGGLTLWSSNNPEFVWRQPMPMSLPIYAAPAGLSEFETDQYYRRRAIDWIISNPTEFALNGVRKLIVLYSFDPLTSRSELSSLYRLVGLFPYGLIFPFIIVGVICNMRNPKFAIILWYVLFTTMMTFVFFGDSRVRAPIQPYLYLYGVLGVQFVLNWWRERRRIFAEVLPRGIE